MHRRRGSQESGAELRYRGQTIPKDHRPVARIHALAPSSIGLGFFVNGNTLAHPKWHFVMGHLQGHYMTKSMPKDFLPTPRMVEMGGGAVGGDHVAKTDTEVTRIPGHTEGADSKVLLFMKYFNDGWPLHFKAVFTAKVAPRGFEQRQNTRAIDRGFMTVHPEDKISIGKRSEFSHHIVQGSQVIGFDVIGILFLDFISEFPAFLF